MDRNALSASYAELINQRGNTMKIYEVINESYGEPSYFKTRKKAQDFMNSPWHREWKDNAKIIELEFDYNLESIMELCEVLVWRNNQI